MSDHWVKLLYKKLVLTSKIFFCTFHNQCNCTICSTENGNTSYNTGTLYFWFLWYADLCLNSMFLFGKVFSQKSQEYMKWLGKCKLSMCLIKLSFLEHIFWHMVHSYCLVLVLKAAYFFKNSSGFPKKKYFSNIYLHCACTLYIHQFIRYSKSTLQK